MPHPGLSVDSETTDPSAIMMCTVGGHTLGVGGQLIELRMGSWSETSDRLHQLPIFVFRRGRTLMATEMSRGDLISTSRAAMKANVSRGVIRRFVASGELREFASELDKRTKFVSQQELDALLGRAITELPAERQLEPAAA